MAAIPPLTDVPVSPMRYERFRPVIGEPAFEALMGEIGRAHRLLDGRVVFNVNSTARGGGVAELLVSLLAYARGAGIDARWHVIGGDEAFFRLTKRIHNRLHGAPGDGGPLGAAERRCYERVAAANAEQLASLVREEDVVLLHDPHTAGLVDALAARGAHVIWRVHVGRDEGNELAHEAWDFLAPYVRAADAYVFSRAAFAWDNLDPGKVCVISPSIDPFSPKNQELDPGSVLAILRAAGILADGPGGSAAMFTRADGTPSRVDMRAEILEEAPLRPADRLVVQVARWDRLKDPLGVMAGFAAGVAPQHDCHLALAGPDTASVTDDPEGSEVFAEVVAAWRELEPDARRRVHLIGLPMHDVEENAVIVNALQRHAAVVVQKSLAEGFGLTVAEAMWKGRPVVASRVGGIQDQIVDGSSGLLVDDPSDLSRFASAVACLLRDPAQAERMGAAAHQRVVERFLGPTHLIRYVGLLDTLLSAPVRQMAVRAPS